VANWAPVVCHAQIVNVLPAARAATSGLSGSITAGLDVSSGNTDATELQADGNITYLSGRHLLLLVLRGELAEQSGTRYFERIFEHLRYRRRLRRVLFVEAFVQHEFDRFRRLSLRALAGVGGRVALALGEQGTLAVGTTPMAEWERLRPGREPDAGDETLVLRLSNYVSLDVRVAKNVRVGQALFVQPRLSDTGDIRLLSESTLSVEAGALLVLPVSFRVAHDTEPPDGVEKTDVRLQSSIGIAF
jgi:putative salt-induced outer membrane protein YdiY